MHANSKTSKDNYIHQDIQGNIVAITDKDGIIQQRRSYTPFGEIRQVLYPEAKESIKNLSAHEFTKKQLERTNRGYTGHEYIEDTNLIHMNGRVYDPTIGRFLSPDPYIQSPFSSQNYNRYSYVMNNPLNLIDPSGYWSVDLGIIKIGNHGSSSSWSKPRSNIRDKRRRF